jgi:hypothetical protein
VRQRKATFGHHLDQIAQAQQTEVISLARMFDGFDLVDALAHAAKIFSGRWPGRCDAVPSARHEADVRCTACSTSTTTLVRAVPLATSS